MTGFAGIKLGRAPAEMKRRKRNVQNNKAKVLKKAEKIAIKKGISQKLNKY